MLASGSCLLTDVVDQLHESSKKINIVDRLSRHLEKGIYSLQKSCSELEIISIKYPRSVFTGESAFYYHSLTDVIPDYYSIATLRTDSRIRDSRVKQSFVKNEIFEMGKAKMQRNNVEINIYSLERMLIELMRFRSKLPFDYYKEIISNYRNKAETMDEVDKIKNEGYSEANAEAKLCQDIIISAISKSSLNRMDIGVHKDLDIEQEEYCFDVCYDKESASVLINSQFRLKEGRTDLLRSIFLQ